MTEQVTVDFKNVTTSLKNHDARAVSNQNQNSFDIYFNFFTMNKLRRGQSQNNLLLICLYIQAVKIVLLFGPSSCNCSSCY